MYLHEILIVILTYEQLFLSAQVSKGGHSPCYPRYSKLVLIISEQFHWIVS